MAARRYGRETARALLAEARRGYAALIPRLPQVGEGRMSLIVSAAMFLALHKALRARGKLVEEIGALVQEAVTAFYGSLPRFLLRLYGRQFFTRSAVRNARRGAFKSHERHYPSDWVFTFVAGDGAAFDWGIDYVECGICKFFHAQGADEFTPYLCRLDFLASDAFGWGLTRTTTLAEGGERCDFRFKRDR